MAILPFPSALDIIEFIAYHRKARWKYVAQQQQQHTHTKKKKHAHALVCTYFQPHIRLVVYSGFKKCNDPFYTHTHTHTQDHRHIHRGIEKKKKKRGC